MKESNSKYDARAVEQGMYKKWLEQGVFTQPAKGKPYAVVLPPPNITGKLHLGHAWDGTLQDVMIRFMRLDGRASVWIPGLDHAGIATQSKFEKELYKEHKLRRQQLPADEFLKRLHAWAEQQKQAIREQWAVLGLALDYSHEKYTMEEKVAKAVRQVFVSLHEQGLIYKGAKLVNWDVVQRTAVSNIEVIHKEVQGSLWHVAYKPITSTDPVLVVATTRPETIYGDVALVVNPSDKRYAQLVNHKYVNPLDGRELPVIADKQVEIAFGTGVLKCTPAHDFTDYAIGLKHHLPNRNVIGFDGKMNELTQDCQGMDIEKARKTVVANLQKQGALVKIEPHRQNVGYSERSDSVAQPLISEQWFVKMKPLSEKVLAMQKTAGRVSFFPKRFNKELTKWLSNIEDWCVSRQLVWGHPIPAWTSEKSGKTVVAMQRPEGKDWIQCQDVLDTWFSSALWPMVCTDWPEQTPFAKKNYPNDLLVTGYDILFFWVSRMMFMAAHFTNGIPFKKVLIHGLIRDEQGRKMSKSLGNGVDPMDIVEKYGADALRLFLVGSSTAGEDLTYSEGRIRESWGVINKLWNAARLLAMSAPKGFLDGNKPGKVTDESRWIIGKTGQLAKQVSKEIKAFEFTNCVKNLKQFVWEDFCNTYLEIVKDKLRNKDEDTLKTAGYVMKQILIMLHPFAPFATDAMAESLFKEGSSLLTQKWPKNLKASKPQYMNQAIALLEKVRAYRGENSIPIAQRLEGGLQIHEQGLASQTEGIAQVLAAANVVISSRKKELGQTDSVTTAALTMHMLHEKQKDTKGQMLDKLVARAKVLESELQRSDKILANEQFVKNASHEKVALEKEKRENYFKELSNIQKEISAKK